MSFQILDHGARNKRRELRRIVGEHHVTEQVAKAEKAKGSRLTTDEKRAVREHTVGKLEKRGFYRDH